jgi:mRNA interferase RelE/StbE
MEWEIQFSKKARQQLEKLDPQVALRIFQFLFERVAASPNPRALGHALKGTELGDLWRYRVGDYRILASTRIVKSEFSSSQSATVTFDH